MRVKRVFAQLAVIVLFVSTGVSAVTAQTQTASEFYMAYRAAFAKAKSIDDILPYMSKGVRAKVEATPVGERAKMFEFIKEMSAGMANLKIIKETKTEEGATLAVEAISEKEKTTGEIQILREDGAWKVGRERWSTK